MSQFYKHRMKLYVKQFAVETIPLGCWMMHALRQLHWNVTWNLHKVGMITGKLGSLPVPNKLEGHGHSLKRRAIFWTSYIIITFLKCH